MRTPFELSQIINRFGPQYIEQCRPNSFTLRTLDALQKCRTSALGGHKEACDCCHKERISYNSCGNRHCPKCQLGKQALWADDRMSDAMEVKYFHVVFTVPEALNQVCLLDSKRFYTAMFDCVWSVLQTFGYSHYGVETGAICVLHTWGQNLSLHPHIHCIVPAAGMTVKGKLKHITKQGKYLYPVRMLSAVFRGRMLEKIKDRLRKSHQLPQYQSLLNELWKKPWVVYCEPPLGNAQQIVKYLGQYTHRVAITNHRIQNIDCSGITFLYKDYKDKGKKKLTHLSGVEFLRRFCLHILPRRFVKIRHYGILSSRQKELRKKLPKAKTKQTKVNESSRERIVRLTGFDRFLCPFCKQGVMHTVELLPRIRSPDNVLYKTTRLSV
ncbi:MAG TPA: IS91 family transposase [Prolixibacteraceae bacterium]|nr:IS91 family transposase [Prolixibacteraceae bacterium]